MITMMLPTVTQDRKSVLYSHTEEEQTVALSSVLLMHQFLEVYTFILSYHRVIIELYTDNSISYKSMCFRGDKRDKFLPTHNKTGFQTAST